jgi:hypothetical protein
MVRSSRYLTFDGQFENAVLGTFRIIRGFADLRHLAEVSVAYEMNEGTVSGQVTGQQRELDMQHAEGIQRYLQNGEQRFLPEVILSVRTELTEERNKEFKQIGVASTGDDGIRITRAWKSENIRVHRVRIDRRKLSAIKANKLIRRVDGNHRLAYAESLEDDPSVPNKYLASFCMVLLGPPDEDADDYSESLIFHTINSTALPLESEHALSLILGQNAAYDMTPEREFSYSPDLHFTRLMRDGLLRLPQPAQSRLGDHPLTSLRNAVRGLLEIDRGAAKDLNGLQQYSQNVLAALNDIVTRLEPSQPALCKAEFFIELAARVWKTTSDLGEYNVRINTSVSFLEELGAWLGNDGFLELKEDQSLSRQLLEVFNVVRNRMPKRVFLARWYPTSRDGEESDKAKLRLKQIRQPLKDIEKDEGVHLELVDMGTQKGGTFPIHAKMYEAINGSDIILVDLTGIRPNVCVEAGYALRNHEKNRLIFIFQQAEQSRDVPFDLNTFRYEPFKDTGEIPDKIKPHISAILRSAAVGL